MVPTATTPNSEAPAHPARRHTERAGVKATGAGRVRWSMHGAFAALALAVLMHGLNTVRLEDVRAADAEMLEQAAAQRALAQLAGRLAALLEAEPAQRSRHADALAALLVRSRDDALQLDDLLKRQVTRSPEAARAVHPALEVWEAARERLWYRGELLLYQIDAGNERALARSAAAVQVETEPTLAAAQALSDTLRDAAAARALALHQQVRVGIAALLALLLVLSVAVVEPTARSVRRHGRRLRVQAAELQRLALVAERTSALVLITDRDDRVQWANAAFTLRSGWPVDEALGQRPGALLAHPQADEDALRRLQSAIAEGRGTRQEVLHGTRDGAELWLDVDLCPLYDEGGALSGYVRVCSDVTARASQQAKLQALWAVLPAGVVVQATDGSIVEANPAAEQLLGLSLEQMQGRRSLDPSWCAVRADGSAYPGEEHPAMRTLATGLALRNETLGVPLADGTVRWLMVNTEPQRDALNQINAVVACFSDVSESRALQEQLSRNARTDELTRLPNRAVVMERLQRALEHLRRNPGYGFALLFMDFDRFKQVNDTLGHGAGDELLRQIADRLSSAVRPGDAVARLGAQDSVAARLGGDEFVVVLDGVQDAATVQQIAQRLQQHLAEPYAVGGSAPVQSSVSIGIVLCHGQDLAYSAEEVLRNADTAMYEAKRAGRGRWVMFDNSMHERVVRALAVENELRQALKNDQLYVVYQPVVDLASGHMVGVEALVRWRHPQRGIVGPADFIGVAEECGLIDAVGALVLGKACVQFMAWQQHLGAAAPRQLAVNLSRAQLEREGVAEEVRAVLQACAMQPEQLQLEVTESLAAKGELVQANLRALKCLGVRLALDDFGTGYSSLACLHQLPVDTVKVDRSFVKHAETAEYHRVLIEATIRVARTLGMTTVAEGIETPGQAALMQALDCDRGQGYHYSRPLEADELARWAVAQQPVAEALVALG